MTRTRQMDRYIPDYDNRNILRQDRQQATRNISPPREESRPLPRAPARQNEHRRRHDGARRDESSERRSRNREARFARGADYHAEPRRGGDRAGQRREAAFERVRRDDCGRRRRGDEGRREYQQGADSEEYNQHEDRGRYEEVDRTADGSMHRDFAFPQVDGDRGYQVGQDRTDELSEDHDHQLRDSRYRVDDRQLVGPGSRPYNERPFRTTNPPAPSYHDPRLEARLGYSDSRNEDVEIREDTVQRRDNRQALQPRAETDTRRFGHRQLWQMSRSNVLVPDGGGRRMMRASSGLKRTLDEDGDSEEEYLDPSKAPRLVNTTILDINVPEGYFNTLTSEEINEQFKSVRALMVELCKKMRRTVFRGNGWTSSEEESRTRGRPGDLILHPTPEFRKSKKRPNDEYLDWISLPHGSLVIKMRPAVISKNAHSSVRTRPCTGFGDSNPKGQQINDRERGLRNRLADYVQILEYPSSSVAAEPECFRTPVYFDTVGDHKLDKDERFAHVYEYYHHPHTVPYKVIGRPHSLRDVQALLKIEQAAAEDLVNPLKSTIVAMTEEMEEVEEKRIQQVMNRNDDRRRLEEDLKERGGGIINSDGLSTPQRDVLTVSLISN